MQDLTPIYACWEFYHTPVEHPRKAHQAWDGLTLHADDPWWSEHYPPLGWGCQCVIYSRSARDLEKYGKSGPDKAPETHYSEMQIGTRGLHPRTVRVPDGVDPGFAYIPGKTSELVRRATRQMDMSAAMRADARPLITTTWRDYDRPTHMPQRHFAAELAPLAHDADEIRAIATQTLGGPTRVFTVGGLPVTVSADALAQHLAADRTPFLPLLIDSLEHPWETWLNIDTTPTGYYELRAKVIAAYDIGRRGKHLFVVSDASHGYLRAVTYVAASNARTAQRARMGVLLAGGEE